MSWTDLTAAVSGTLPSARCLHGFSPGDGDGKVYLMGGENSLGMISVISGQILFSLEAAVPNSHGCSPSPVLCVDSILWRQAT